MAGPKRGFTADASYDNLVGGVDALDPGWTGTNPLLESQAMNSGPPGTGAWNPNDQVNANYWWEDPFATVGNIFGSHGWSQNPDNPFYDIVGQLTPGAQWMSMLGNANNYVGGYKPYMDSLIGGLGTPGADWGKTGMGVAQMIQRFIDLAQGQTAGGLEIQQMLGNDPRRFAGAVGDLARTAGFGHTGAGYARALENKMLELASQFAGMGQPNSGDAFGGFLDTAESQLMDWLGI